MKHKKDAQLPQSTTPSSEQAPPVAPAVETTTAPKVTEENTRTSATPKSKVSDQAIKTTYAGTKRSTVAIALSLLIGVGMLFYVHQQNEQVQQQITLLNQKLTESNHALAQQKTQSDQAQQQLEQMRIPLSQQQKSIESLQSAISDLKGRRPSDWLLAEAEYLVKLAGRKLFLERDLDSARYLIEHADQRIAELNDPSLTPLRQAIAQDLTRLNAIPFIDTDGLILQLSSLQQTIDQLPIAQSQLSDNTPQTAPKPSSDLAQWKENALVSLKNFADNFITFRVREGNVAPLLSPNQHFYLQENLKNQLTMAIRAIFQQQQTLYDQSIAHALQWSHDYLDLNQPQVQAFNQALQQLATKTISVDYPAQLASEQPLENVIRERLRRAVQSPTTEEAQ